MWKWTSSASSSTSAHGTGDGRSLHASQRRKGILQRRPFRAAVASGLLALVLFTLFGGASGRLDIATAGPGTNDDFANAITITSDPFVWTQSTVGATLEAGEPQPCGGKGSTVWFKLTPSANTTVTIDTIGSDYNTVLAAYTGNTVDTLATVACNDDTFGLLSEISFSGTAGVTYRIQAGGFTGDTGTLSITAVGVGTGSVVPISVTESLAAGTSIKVNKLISVEQAAQKADVYFLADTTGSMGSVIASVQTGASTVLGTIQGLVADVQFGAGQYKDFPFDAFAFSNDASIGTDDGVGGAFDASDAIAAWFAVGGNDGPEGQLFALDRIADAGDPTSIGFRPDASKILVWFGDAPGHDPVCSAISGLGFDITEASATAKLAAAQINVVAISTLTGFVAGLDDSPLGGGDYLGACGFEGGASGQATRIASATGGVHDTGVAAGDIADAIINGIGAVILNVTPIPVGCSPLNVTFSPPSFVAGDPPKIAFNETIAVPLGTPEGKIACTVEFYAEAELIGVQNISITVTLPPKLPDPGDTDLDGCSDQAENGPDPLIGGLRNYLDFWDFYDVWSHPPSQPTVWIRDKVINVPGEILGVAGRFGPGPTPVSEAQSRADALATPANSNGYHAAFDRGPITGANNWNRGPADGSINVPHDILGVANQFGHDCS